MPTRQSSEILGNFAGNVQNKTVVSRNSMQSKHANPQVYYGNVTIIQNLTVQLTIRDSRIFQVSVF